MAIIFLPEIPPSNGLWLTEDGLRNGVVPPGPKLRLVAQHQNALVGLRGKVIFHRVNRPGAGDTYPDTFNAVAAADTFRFRWHSSPVAHTTVCRMILAPTDNTVTNAPTPKAFWTTTPDGGGPTTQPTIYQNHRVGAGTAVDPNDWTMVEQVWSTIAADTSHQAVLNQEDQLRIISCTVWELPRVALDTGSDTYAVDSTGCHDLALIHDGKALDMYASMMRVWKHQGAVFFAYTRPGSSAFTTTATSATNVLDSTTGAWSANNAGFQCDGTYRGSIETYNSGTNRETIPVHLWAVVGITGGATATVTFRDQNATIGTLTTTATGANWVTSSTTWVAPSNATMKVDVMLHSSSGAQTASLYAAGMYQYEA